MAVLPKCCSHTLPSPGYFGMLEKVWLTPGRNPLATAIYREETVTFASGAYEGERERKTERERDRDQGETKLIHTVMWIVSIHSAPHRG